MNDMVRKFVNCLLSLTIYTNNKSGSRREYKNFLNSNYVNFLLVYTDKDT